MSATATTAEDWDATQRKLQNSEQWKYATGALTSVEHILNKWNAGKLTPPEAFIIVTGMLQLTPLEGLRTGE